MTKNRTVGVISVFLGLTFGYLTRKIPDSMMAGDPGSRLFPSIACVLFLICGVGLIVTRSKEGEDEVFLTPRQWGKLLAMFAVMAAYYALLDLVGFLPLSVALLYALSSMFSFGEKVAWWKRLLYSVLITAVLYLGFTKLLAVPLPMGFLK